MAKDIGKIKLDFQIYDTKKTTSIILADFSEWKVIENLPATMSITIPGSRKPIILPFQKGATQGYNSLSLGLTCVEPCKNNLIPLPDGIYEFCLRGGKEGQHKLNKFYLKKDLLEEEHRQAWINLGLEYNPNQYSNIKELLEIKGFIETSAAFAIEGDKQKAQQLYDMAEQKLKKYKSCKDCI